MGFYQTSFLEIAEAFWLNFLNKFSLRQISGMKHFSQNKNLVKLSAGKNGVLQYLTSMQL